MFKAYLLGTVFLLLGPGNAIGCDEKGETGILPENDMRISVYDKNTSGISKREFLRVFDRIEKIYTSVFYQNGEKLTFKKDWHEDQVNAYAYKNDNKAFVVINGGLARHPDITVDAVALTACHEVGHHIGGIPVKKKGPGRLVNGRVIKKAWASNEGQADYFGVMKCLRKYFEGDDNRKIISKMKYPSKMAKKCEKQFKNKEDRAVCIRSMVAGFHLTKMFTQLTNYQLEKAGKDFRLPPVNLLKDAEKVAKETDDKHPLPQCRLDTFRQGALCDQDHSIDVSYTDEAQGLCTRSYGYKVGIRPLCWYKPPRS